MQRDYVYPVLGNRASPKEWVEQGQPILVNKATERKEMILSKPSRARMAPDVDAAIRSRFNIHLN